MTFPSGADRVQVDVCTTGCAANPPVFIDGTPAGSTTPGFPAGVSPADIQGIRVTFSSSTSGYTILPGTAAPGGGSCPGSSVCLVVQARNSLRSDPGKPIPDLIPDSASGAGSSQVYVYAPPTYGAPPVEGAPKSGTPATVIITNEFAMGAIRLTKRVVGPGAHYADRDFHFHLDCGFNGRTGVVSRDAVLRRPDLTTELTDLPVGAVCTVTETDQGGADEIAAPAKDITVKEGTTAMRSSCRPTASR